MAEAFEAMVAEEVDGKVAARLATLTFADLPDHDVLVEIACSTLNYKDGLCVSGAGRIARRLPMVCGIDLAGTVVDSRSPDWTPGDRVVVNGWGLSETEWGGYSLYERLKPQWLMRLPEGFAPEQAMAIGTAGYTAALAVDALERHGIEKGRDVLVPGAAGGVGSVAIALLARSGHRVVASTGRPEEGDYLRALGAAEVIDRATLAAKGGAMQKERWAAAIDSVGGQTLATVLAQTAANGAVAACGLAGGNDLPGSVFPFILRGVALLGIDSVYAAMPRRIAAWARLDRDLDRGLLARMTSVAGLSDVPRLAHEIVAGKVRGRVVIDVAR